MVYIDREAIIDKVTETLEFLYDVEVSESIIEGKVDEAITMACDYCRRKQLPKELEPTLAIMATDMLSYLLTKARKVEAETGAMKETKVGDVTVAFDTSKYTHIGDGNAHQNTFDVIVGDIKAALNRHRIIL